MIQLNTFRYALFLRCISDCVNMDVGLLLCTYMQICTGYSSCENSIHTDTFTYIQNTAMCISYMHRAYAICTMMYVDHIEVHMCLY